MKSASSNASFATFDINHALANMSAQFELLEPPKDAISSICFSRDSRALAVGSWDGHVHIHGLDTHPAATLAFVKVSPPDSYLQERLPDREPVLDICFGAIGEGVFSVGLSGGVYEGRINGAEGRLYSTHGEASNKVAYSPEQNLLISTSWDSTMHVHDATSGRYIRLALPSKPFALSTTPTRVVVAMAQRKVSVYNLSDLRARVDEISAVDPEDDTASDAERKIQHIEPWQQRESSLKFMTRAVACMPDDAGFVTSSIEGRVGVEWFQPERQGDMYAFKCHRQIEKTTDEDGNEQEVDVVFPVNALAFHPVYGSFATGGGDGVVALWDAKSKRRIKQYPKLSSSIAALAFSGDGKWLAMGVSPSFEDGGEEDVVEPGSVKIVVRALTEGEAKGKAMKEKAGKS